MLSQNNRKREIPGKHSLFCCYRGSGGLLPTHPGAVLHLQPQLHLPCPQRPTLATWGSCWAGPHPAEVRGEGCLLVTNGYGGEWSLVSVSSLSSHRSIRSILTHTEHGRLGQVPAVLMLVKPAGAPLPPAVFSHPLSR